MGNIRPTYIKRVSAELFKIHGEKFAANFDSDKKMVNQLCDVKSKTMRNKITGGVLRLKKRQEHSGI